MEKSRVEISTNYPLSIYCMSGSRTHIILLNLRKNYARHMCPHCVGEKTEIQIGQVTKGSRRAGWQSWGLAYALPAPRSCSLRGARWSSRPLQGCKNGPAHPLFLLLMCCLFWGPGASQLGLLPWFSTSKIIW